MLPSASATMADDMITSCSYCDSQHTQYDYALHRVSNAHVKKVQRKLLHRGLSSVCLICNFALKSLRQAELHVQEKTHKERMKSFPVESYLRNDKCTCWSCGITFFNELGLEAHRASHDAAASPLHTPKLDELSGLLGGVHGQEFMLDLNRSCRICDIAFDRVEDSIMHLFESPHVSSLRSSACMVCKKEFTHASDRELHIKSYKHTIALQKCGNLLEEGRAQATFRKGGYPCMVCMLWCNSWFCLELHLLDKHHAKMTVQSQAKRPMLERIVFLTGKGESGNSAGCDESIVSSWRHWRGEAAGERIWCHRCGVSLKNIDEVNKHWDKHDLDKPQTTSRLHSSRASHSDMVSESFGCSLCELSFKTDFMLSAHDASFEHHSRLAAFCEAGDLLCCSNCGLLMHNEGDKNGASVSKEVQGSSLQKTGTEVSPQRLQLLHYQIFSSDESTKTSSARLLDSVMPVLSSGEGSRQILAGADADDIEATGFSEADNREKPVTASTKGGSGEPVASVSRDWNCLNRRSTENDVLMNGGFCTKPTCNDNKLGNQSSDFGHFPKPSKYPISTNNVDDGNGMGAQQRFDANENCVGPHTANPVRTNGSLSEVSMPNAVENSSLLHGCLQLAHAAGPDDSLTQQNPVWSAGHVSKEDGCEYAKEVKVEGKGVPIVVAATFAPLGSLQESLQSVTAIVTESLASALSMCVEQSTALLKRKSQSEDQQDLKRPCPETFLEAALRQGLRSVSSNGSASRDLDASHHLCANKAKLRQSIGNEKGVQEPHAVVAVAASIIPNGVGDFSRPPGSQDHVEVNKNSCAVRSDDERTQESADMKLESLSQGVVHDQGYAGSNGMKTEGKEKPIEVGVFHTQQRSSLPCNGIQNMISATPAHPRVEGSAHSTENAIPSAAKEPAAAAPLGVVAPAIFKHSENDGGDGDDDDDDYAFLDPTKTHSKWWSSSDSEENGM